MSIFYVLMLVSFITAAYLAADIYRTGGSFAIPDVQSLLALVALGLFSQSVGWILITNALPQVRASLSPAVRLRRRWTLIMSLAAAMGLGIALLVLRLT